MWLVEPTFTNHPICSIRSSAAANCVSSSKKAIFENRESHQSVARLARANFGLKAKAAREGQRGSSELSGAQRVNRIRRGPCVISERGCEQLGPSLRCELTQVFLELFKRRLFRDQFSNKRCGNFLVEIQ
jgi:hypothetical protein